MNKDVLFNLNSTVIFMKSPIDYSTGLLLVYMY
jgi:hypothetical protein